MLQGERQGPNERSSGQQHRRQQRRPAESTGGSLQPTATPGRSSDGAAVRSGDGAAQGAPHGARHARKRDRDGGPSLGGGLRIFRSAMAADGPPLHSASGSKSRAGRGLSSGRSSGRSGGRSGAGGSGTLDLDLLRQRALAAHAVSKP